MRSIDDALFKIISGQIRETVYGKLGILKNSTNIRKFNHRISLHQYERAAEFMPVFSDCSSPDILRKLSACLCHSNREEDAILYMSKAIEKKGCSVSILEAKILEFMKEDIKEIHFVCKKGFANFGFFDISMNSGENWIAKICDEKDAPRECIFYKEIYPYFPTLHKYIPKLYGEFSVQGLHVIIFENITGIKNIDTNPYCISIIGQMCNASAPEIFRAVKEGPTYNGNYEAGHLESAICQKYILSSMKKNIHAAKADAEIGNWVDKFREIIIGKKIYKKISKNAIYGFCHNDFHKNNIIVDDGCPHIIDWANYAILLKGWDLVYYLGNYEEDFTYIKNIIETMIFPDNTEGYLSGRGMLGYMFFYVWTQRLHGKYDSVLKDRCFDSAAQYALDNFNALLDNGGC